MKKIITLVLLAGIFVLGACSSHTCPTYMKNNDNKIVKNQDQRV